MKTVSRLKQYDRQTLGTISEEKGYIKKFKSKNFDQEGYKSIVTNQDDYKRYPDGFLQTPDCQSQIEANTMKPRTKTPIGMRLESSDQESLRTGFNSGKGTAGNTG